MCPSHLDKYRDDHRTAPVILVHPAADDAPDQLPKMMGIADSVLGREHQRLFDPRPDIAERGLVDAGAAGVDLRAGHHLPVGECTTMRTDTKPSSPSMRRSFSDASVTSPTESPST